MVSNEKPPALREPNDVKCLCHFFPARNTKKGEQAPPGRMFLRLCQVCPEFWPVEVDELGCGFFDDACPVNLFHKAYKCVPWGEGFLCRFHCVELFEITCFWTSGERANGAQQGGTGIPETSQVWGYAGKILVWRHWHPFLEPFFAGNHRARQPEDATKPENLAYMGRCICAFMEQSIYRTNLASEASTPERASAGFQSA